MWAGTLVDSESTAGTTPAADDVARAQAGDREAVERVLARVAQRVLAACRGVLGKQAPEAEDAAQEALVRFVDSLAAYRGQCPVEHFAAGIAVRTAMRARRRVARRRPLFDAYARGVEDGQACTPDAHERLLRRKRLDLLRRLLDELPEAQAEALALRCVVGHSLAEVSAIAGAPINTIRSRVRLARKAMLERIRSDPELRELLEVTHAE